MIKKTAWLVSTSFLAGMTLLFVNIYGQFASLRSPTLQEDVNRINENDITISENQIYTAIKEDYTDPKSFTTEMTNTIHNGIGRYWENEGADKFRLRIPFRENFILFIASYLMPEKFEKYELLNYQRAIERGAGQCSQHAIILAQVLFERGVKTRMVGLQGHVVVTALVDEVTNEWWILDSDYGVVIPYDLETIEKNPKIIAPYYTNQGYDMETVSWLVDIYGIEGNVIMNGYGIGDYSIRMRIFEQLTYIMIWIIPVLLMFPILILKKQYFRKFFFKRI